MQFHPNPAIIDVSRLTGPRQLLDVFVWHQQAD
jgi:hypothetical protein